MSAADQHQTGPGDVSATELSPSSAPPPTIDTELDIEQPVLVKPKGLVGVILLLMVLTATLAIVRPSNLRPGAAASLALSTWQPDVQVIASIQRRRALRVKDRLPTTPDGIRQAKQIVTSMRAYLLDESRLGYEGVRADPQARVRLGKLEEAIRGFALAHGNAAFRALAIAESQQGGELAERALVAATAARQPIGANRGNPNLPAIAALEAHMPGLSGALARAGVQRFVHGERLVPAARLLIEALIEQRWMVFAQRLPPPPPQRDSDMRRLLLAYRIEAHPGLSTRRKLQLMDELSALDATYPAHYVTAVLLARERRYRAARTLFLRAATAGQLPEQARANASWCRIQLREEGKS